MATKKNILFMDGSLTTVFLICFLIGKTPCWRTTNQLASEIRGRNLAGRTEAIAG
jgi:hypothetical protein